VEAHWRKRSIYSSKKQIPYFLFYFTIKIQNSYKVRSLRSMWDKVLCPTRSYQSHFLDIPVILANCLIALKIFHFLGVALSAGLTSFALSRTS